jgi:3-methyladenine DNA glycosylase/8-oxoguanine DNA glycosylase
MVRIPLPPAVDVAWTLRYLVVRAVESLEVVQDGGYRRSIGASTAHPALVLDLRHDVQGKALLARTSPAQPPPVVRALVVRLFDLDADLAAFLAVARRDPILGPLVRARPALRLPQLPDPFEGLVRAILGQQVSVVGASTMTDRLVRRFGAPIAGDALCTFPSPATLADAGPEQLRGIGLTTAKAATLHRVADAVATGAVSLAAVRSAPTAEAEAMLVALPGIGPWTANYVRMRALGDRDAFPAADLGVLKAMALHGVAARDIAARAEEWRPWRAYATLHLWESLGKRPDLPDAAVAATAAKPTAVRRRRR